MALWWRAGGLTTLTFATCTPPRGLLFAPMSLSKSELLDMHEEHILELLDVIDVHVIALANGQDVLEKTQGFVKEVQRCVEQMRKEAGK